MTKLEIIASKICGIEVLMRKIAVWRFHNRKIIFTNGCFDVLHRGHVYLLAKAAGADAHAALIVGLNSDASVKRLKGAQRPINNFDDRAFTLAGLYAVDAVTGFEDDTPHELIQIIQPDYLIKGGDWKEEDIVGADIVKNRGGKINIIPYINGYSTSEVIKKIQSL